MIEEKYISFDTAKKLVIKGLGYDDCEYSHYYAFENCIVPHLVTKNSYDPNLAPRLTLEIAAEWIASKYGIYIGVEPSINHNSTNEKDKLIWKVIIFNDKNLDILWESDTIYADKNKAYECGINICIDNYI